VLKDNIRDIWLQKFVQERTDMVQLDAAIIMNPQVWIASGHVSNFADPLIDCKKCKTRSRADHLLEPVIGPNEVAKLSLEEMGPKLRELNIKCPNCGELDWTEARRFNLLFETSV
jgi:glycyl-tRNA synthetase